MINWNQFPFVRLLIPFASGIVAAVHLSLRAGWVLPVLSGLVVAYFILLGVMARYISYRYRWVLGLLVHAILFLSGYRMAMDSKVQAGKAEKAGGDIKRSYSVLLLDNPSEKLNSFSCPVKILGFSGAGGWTAGDEKALVYLQKGDRVKALRYGDRLCLVCSFREVPGPGNPGEFDYQSYLKYSGIRRQAFIKQEDWVRVDSGGGSRIIRWSKQVREHLLAMIRDHGIEGRSLALASAVLLGYDEYLDDEQQRQFSGAGAMHVLCVSGLHVGIIALVLNNLLLLLNRNRYLRVLKLALLILLIWSYAAITGLSPSVLRAATMFSFICAGKSFKRKVSIYNMLAASAFLLLVIDPYMLTRVGFQLSYLAVTGIVLVYEPLSGLLQSRFSVVDRVWQLTVVSVAATLTTFPLSIYYFHQFPNYFLLTNLVAIPASFLIVYSGMLMLAFDFIPLLSMLSGKMLALVLFILDRSVGFIEGLPFSTSTGLYLDTSQLVLLLVLVFSMVSLVLLRTKMFLFAGFFLGILLAGSFTIRKYSILKQCEVVVYQVRGHTAMEFFRGRESVFICDSALLDFPGKMEYAMAGNRLAQGVSDRHTFILDNPSIRMGWLAKEGCLIWVSGYTFLLLDDGVQLPAGGPQLHIDMAIVCNTPGADPNDLEELCSPRTLVLDASMPPWAAGRWREQCIANGRKYHDIAGMGAYVMKIE